LIDVVSQLLPIAAYGLEKISVSSQESKRLLAVIENRLNTGRNGAIWQLKNYSDLLSSNLRRPEACRRLVSAYGERSVSNTPVSEWSDI